MTTEYTPNFSLAMPDFRMGPWHDLINKDMAMIDALLYSALSNSNVEPWENDTEYAAGISVIDGDDATVWVCVVPHTSIPEPGTFAEDRAANPTYWTQLLAGFAPRGEWQNATNYFPYDLAFSSNQGIFAICTTRHTSNVDGTIKDDDEFWSFLVDLSEADIGSAIAVTYSNVVSGLGATNVQDALDQIDAVNDTQATQIVALNNVNITQGNRLDAIETLNTSQDTRLSGVESTNTSQATAIADHESRLDALEAAPGTVFPAGTRLLFGNVSVPTGWVRDTTVHDRALRVVGTGNGGVTGGSAAFSSVFNKFEVGSTALTAAQMPIHAHGTTDIYNETDTSGSGPPGGFSGIAGPSGHSSSTGNAGSGQGHVHPLELRLAYYDMILGVKS